MFPIIEYIGITAGILTTFSFLPQVIKIWQTRDVSSISLIMYSLFCIGVAMWLIYGISLGSFSLILANAVTLVLAGCVLFLKIFIKEK
jgi:MtN3 and saliva related transmembrane protein